MFPSFLTLEACLQQALDLHPPWSVSKAEFDPAPGNSCGDCSVPLRALCLPGLRRAAAAGAILFYCGGLDLSSVPAFPHETR